MLIRQLIRALYTQDNQLIFGTVVTMKRIEIRELLQRLGVNVSLNYISQQKSNKFLPFVTPQTGKTLSLMEKILVEFPRLDPGKFWMR
jgi:hypothetical protein